MERDIVEASGERQNSSGGFSTIEKYSGLKSFKKECSCGIERPVRDKTNN